MNSSNTAESSTATACHTSGDWHHDETTIYLQNGLWHGSVKNDNAETIALICAGKREIVAANARLIAAAPELLALAEKADRLLGASTNPEALEIAALARSAIAKAYHA